MWLGRQPRDSVIEVGMLWRRSMVSMGHCGKVALRVEKIGLLLSAGLHALVIFPLRGDQQCRVLSVLGDF